MELFLKKRELIAREQELWNELLVAEQRLTAEPSNENKLVYAEALKAWEKIYDVVEKRKDRIKDYVLNFGVTGLKLVGNAGLILLAGNIELVQGKLFPPSARPRADIGTLKL